MPRNLTAAVIAETEKKLLRPALFADMTFTSGVLRLWTGYGPVVLDGQTYLGTGHLGAVSPIVDSSDVQATPLKMSLSGIPSELVAQVFDEARQGAPVTLRQGFVDSSMNVIADPYTAWAGKMGSCVIDESASTATVTLTVENDLVNLRRGPVGAQSKAILTAAMLSASDMDLFSASSVVDGNVTDTAWRTHTSLVNAYVQVDLGADNEHAFRRLRLYMNASGYAAVYSVQWSDNEADWTDAATDVIPSNIGWNDFELAPDGEHRYWRLLLTSAAVGFVAVTEMEFWSSSVDEAALIAAANVCDESVELAGSGTESRYTINGSFSLDEVPGDVLPRMNSAMAGSVVFAGGKWGVYPAVWRDASLSLTDNDLLKPISVQIRRESRDLFNAVRGVYISPENANQPSDFPPFSENAWVVEDQNERAWVDIELPFTTSGATAQRLAKIALRRNRKQVLFEGRFKVRAWQVQPMDVVLFTHQRFNWVSKSFEVVESRLAYEEDESGKAYVVGVDLVLAESDYSVYEWSSDDENSINVLPSPALPQPGVVAPPTSLAAESLAQLNNGVIVAGVRLTWTAPDDAQVTQGGKIVIQYKRTADTNYTSYGFVSGDVEEVEILPLIDKTSYDFRIWAESVEGVRSTIASTTFTPTTSVYGGPSYRFDPNPLAAVDNADSPSTATINCGQAGSPELPVHMLVQGIGEFDYSPGSIPDLENNRTYHVCFDDPEMLGGTVTFLAKDTKAEAMDRAGRFLLGTITTPRDGAPPTSGGTVGGGGGQSEATIESFPADWVPVADGNGSITNPGNLNDGDKTSFARLSITGTGSINRSAVTLSSFSLPALPFSSVKLYIRTAVPTFSLTGAGGPQALLLYSLDGTTFNTVFDVNTTRPDTIDVIDLTGVITNASAVRVAVIVFASASQVSGAADLDFYETWLVGTE